MTSEPDKLVSSKSKWLRVTIVLLSVSLVSVVSILVWAMVYYRLPGSFWKRMASISDPIPELILDTAYDAPQIKPELGFSNSAIDSSKFASWQQRGKDKLLELLHVSPMANSLNVRTIASEKVGTILRETLVFKRPDGIDVPAYLFLPNVATMRPAVIVIPGHSRGIVATGGVVEDYQHANALRIAEAGYVVLTMEIRGFGYLGRMTNDSDLVVLDSYVAYMLTSGQTAMGIVIGDIMDGIGYLLLRDEVDTQQIGVVGFSSGGKTAIYLAAVDERVDVVVASGCVTDHEHNFLHSRHDSYEAIPGLGSWLAFSDCMGLVAPRPMLVQWGKMDTNVVRHGAAFNDGSMPTYQAAKHVYESVGAVEALEYQINVTMGHEFDNTSAIAFLKKTLPIRR